MVYSYVAGDFNFFLIYSLLFALMFMPAALFTNFFSIALKYVLLSGRIKVPLHCSSFSKIVFSCAFYVNINNYLVNFN